MAGSIKGLTIEIGGDTTKLTQALKEPASHTKDLKDRLSSLNTALKFDTTNVDLLDQKQRVLKETIKSTEDELKLLKQAQQEYKDSGKDIDGKEYIELEKKIATVEASLKNLEGQQNNFNGQVQAMGEKLGTFGESAKSAGSTLTSSLTGPILEIGKSALQTTADFDSGMSEVAAISGATGSEVDALREKAREMGATTKFSASESAEALKYMAMAGWEPTQMMDGLSGVMNLAAASGEELGTTSDIVTDALTAFGMKAEEAGHFADVLAQASSKSNTNVSLLGESFKYCAPVAGALGASAEDTAIALGLMANAGIKGSQAGNSLKNALVNLFKPTDDQASAMKRLGIIEGEWVTTSDADATKLQKLNATLLDRQAALTKAQETYEKAVKKHGASSSEAEAAYKKVESAELKLSAANSQLQTEMSKTSAHFEQTGNLLQDEYGNTKSLGEIMDVLRSKLGRVDVELVNADGTAREYDEIMADLANTTEGLAQAQQIEAAATLFGKQNLSGMLAIINASDEDYQKLTESIYDCTGVAEDMANTMNDNLNGQITLLKSALEELFISIGDVMMPVLRKGVSIVQGWVDKLNSMSDGTKRAVVIIGALAAAIGPALVAIGKMSLGAQALIKYLGSVETFGGKLLASFKSMVGASSLGVGALAAIGAAIAALVAAFVHLWQTNEDFRTGMIDIWNGIVEKLQTFFQGITERLNALGFDFQDFTEVIGALWDGFCNLLAPVFTAVFETISNTLSYTLDVLTGLLDIFIGLFTGNWDQCWQGINEVFEAAWNYILNTFTTIKDLLWGILEEIFGWFGADWEAVWEEVKLSFEAAWNWIVDVFAGVKQSIMEIWEPITEFFQGIWDVIKGIWEGDSELISQGIDECWNGIKTLTETIWTDIKNFWEATWEGLKKTAKDIWESLKKGIPEAWEAIKKFTSDTWNNIKKFLSDTWDNLKRTAEDIWDKIKTAISDRWEKLKTGATEFGKQIADRIGTKWNEIKTDAANKWENIKTEISNKWSAMVTDAGNKWNNLKTNIMAPIRDAWAYVCNILNNFNNRLYSSWSYIQNLTWNIWNNVYTAIVNPFNEAKNFIWSGIEQIKSFFNFQFQWPHIPMPHFSISGSMNPFDWFDGGLPSISVSWYAKAMDKGLILNQPTIFGAQNGKLLGAGEAGPEAVVGVSSLLQMIRESIQEVLASPLQLGRMLEDAADVIAVGLNSQQAAMALMAQQAPQRAAGSGGYDAQAIDYDRLAAAVADALARKPIQAVAMMDGKVMARQLTPDIDKELARQAGRR